jgi:hypothetical protein
MAAGRRGSQRLRSWGQRWVTVRLVAAWLVLTGTGAAAPAPNDRGDAPKRLHLALRSGYGVPLGGYATQIEVNGIPDDDLPGIADDTSGVIPIWLDVGYRLHPNIVLAAYAMYGIALLKVADPDDPFGGGCPELAECSAAGWRFGVEAEYQFAPAAFVNPWVSLGVGYELLHSHVKVQMGQFVYDRAFAYSGPDLLHLQAGVDLGVSPAFGVGPFASVSFARYLDCSAEDAGARVDCELVEGATHSWLAVGVRGSLRL